MNLSLETNRKLDVDDYCVGLIFIALFFSTNSQILSVYLVFLFSILSLSVIFFVNPSFKKINFAFVAFLIIAIAITQRKSVYLSSYDDYYIWPFLLISACPVIYYLMKVHKYSYITISAQIFTVFFILSLFYTETPIISALFGANILYRINLFFYGLIIINTVFKQKKPVHFLIWTSFFYFNSLMIDSRAGMVIFIFMVLVAVSGLLFPKKNMYFRYIGSFLVIYIIQDLQEFFYYLSYLGINLSIYNASEAYRLEQWGNLMNYDVILYQKYTVEHLYYQFMGYPHSIIVESLAYGGIYSGLIMIPIVIYTTYVTMFDNEYIHFTGIVIGIHFSGDMRDNYVIVLIFIAIILIKRKKLDDAQRRQDRRQKDRLRSGPQGKPGNA